MQQRTLTLTLIAALALVAPFALSTHPAAAQYAHPPQVGTISSRQGSSFTLGDGVTVFMHPGTVINPEGTDLEPGMTVTVTGYYNNDGSMNANVISVGAPANYYRNESRGWYDTNGNFHYYSTQRGWYDTNGNWHPMPANGWYDTNGNWHAG
jgi:hypothetical protein